MKYLFLLVLLVGCGDNVSISNSAVAPSGTKFNVGDCIRTVSVYESDDDYEFVKPETTSIVLEYKVLAVGKKKYHLQFGKKLFTERYIEYVNKQGTKIDCKELDF